MDLLGKTDTIDISALVNKDDETNKQKACFIVIAGNDLGKVYNLSENDISIGRGSENTIQIQDDAVSRNHAQVVRNSGGEFSVRDLKSTNGTFCNGERIEEQGLSDGDKIMVGTTTILKFSFHDALDLNFQKHLFDSAVRDWLTKCYNKKYFEEHLPIEFNFATRHNAPLSLIIFDLDHFKNINDTHGHLIGDYVLKSIARSVAGSLRNEDIFARYGGEEFTIIARETSQEQALVVADRLCKSIEQAPLEYGGRIISATISLGVATYVDGKPVTPTRLLDMADKALYAAKQGGRNRVVAYDKSLG